VYLTYPFDGSCRKKYSPNDLQLGEMNQMIYIWGKLSIFGVNGGSDIKLGK